jgi:hypothetical protein
VLANHPETLHPSSRHKQFIQPGNRAAVVLALFDALLQVGFEPGMDGDGVVEQGIAAGLVGADGDQVARALVARKKLLEPPVGSTCFGRGLHFTGVCPDMEKFPGFILFA